MKLLNALEDFKAGAEAGADAAVREGFGILLRVLYPVTPHIAHELWQVLGYARRHGELLDAPWPKVDEQALVRDEIELVLQINGKHRGSVRVPASATRQEIEQLAVASEDYVKHAGAASPHKVIVVPGRLVNVVVAQ
jgi:leucyl-tRNA synthetase